MFWSKLSVEKLDRKGKAVYNNRVSPQGLSTTSGTTSQKMSLADWKGSGIRNERKRDLFSCEAFWRRKYGANSDDGIHTLKRMRIQTMVSTL